MNTIGVLVTVAVFVTVHFSIMKMFKKAAKPVPKPSIVRSKWI